MTTGPDLAPTAGRTVQGWPLGLGLVFAVVVGVVVGGGFATIVFVCGAIAVAAYQVTSPPVAAGLVAAGLVGHAVWDVLHHRRGVVVTRSYAEFCAAFDVGLAVIVLLASR